MQCEGCTDVLRTDKDYKYGYCGDCRRKAFGFGWDGKSHTEEKDRRTCNVVGASAAEFQTGQLR